MIRAASRFVKKFLVQTLHQRLIDKALRLFPAYRHLLSFFQIDQVSCKRCHLRHERQLLQVRIRLPDRAFRHALDANGQLVKVHGGAILKNTVYSTIDDEVVHRKEQNREAKDKIARYAAGLITAEDFVYIDAGTTTERMIDYIANRQAVFVTNAIGHAKKLAEHGCKVYILGGEFKAVTEAIVGEEAVFTLDKYNFTKGFWGANGVSLQKGFSTPELKEAMVKRKSMENCRDCYILADESKFSQISSVTFAPFEKATVITTELKQEIYKDCSNIINIE